MQDVTEALTAKFRDAGYRVGEPEQPWGYDPGKHIRVTRPRDGASLYSPVDNIRDDQDLDHAIHQRFSSLRHALPL